MIVQAQKTNKFIFLFLVCFTLSGCTAQKINVNRIVDTYINYYSPKNKIFNPKETFLQIGINEEKDNPKEKNIYINNNCFSCVGKINEKDVIVEYKGYKVVIYYDISQNKNILLSNFKNIKKTQRFLLNNINNNIINDAGNWAFSYDEQLNIKYFCNTNRMDNMIEDIKEIKQKLEINDVEDCISIRYKKSEN